MGTRQGSAISGRTWAIYLVVGVVVLLAYYLAVGTNTLPVLQVTLYCGISSSAAVMVFVGARRNLRTTRERLPWLLLGASQVVYATADTCFYVAHTIRGDTSYPALADPLYLSHYSLVVLGLLLLIHRRTPGRDVASVLDAATIAVAVGLLSWLYLMAPQTRADEATLVKVVSVAYPVMDLAMFAVAVRLVLGPGRRPPSFLLLAGNLFAIYAADTLYVIQQLNGTYHAGNFLDAIWLSGNLLLGAAALHPTVSRIGEPAETLDFRPSPLRLALLASGALVAPVALLLRYSVGQTQDIPVIAAACGVLFLLTIARLGGLVADQRRQAITDVLTGLRTRRFFSDQLKLEIARARRAGNGLALLIVDVDHFKSINDRYGHPAGDLVLIEVARRLRESVRHEDFLARYGGEEFALVVPGASPQELASIGERLRTQVARTPIAVSADVLIPVTVSVGTAGYPRHGSTPSDLIIMADRALYAAKAQGRDRVVVGEAEGAVPVTPPPRVPSNGGGDMLGYLQLVADEVDGWLSSYEHGRAVGRWAALVAAALDRDEVTVQRVELAGKLHDIGKVLIPQAIWRKPSALSKYERQLVQQHSDYGFQLVSVVPGLLDVAETIRQHHERLDGKGYPLGLEAKEIRLEARIVAVCDSWAAMLADRPYHEAMSTEQAIAELVGGRGFQFDPDVVDALLDLHRRNLLGPLRTLAVEADIPRLVP